MHENALPKWKIEVAHEQKDHNRNDDDSILFLYQLHYIFDIPVSFVPSSQNVSTNAADFVAFPSFHKQIRNGFLIRLKIYVQIRIELNSNTWIKVIHHPHTPTHSQRVLKLNNDFDVFSNRVKVKRK